MDWIGRQKGGDPRWMGDDLGENKRKGHRGERNRGITMGRVW